MFQHSFYESTRILFVHKENKNNSFIQQLLIFCVFNTRSQEKMNKGLMGLEQHEGE